MIDKIQREITCITADHIEQVSISIETVIEKDPNQYNKLRSILQNLRASINDALANYFNNSTEATIKKRIVTLKVAYDTALIKANDEYNLTFRSINNTAPLSLKMGFYSSSLLSYFFTNLFKFISTHSFSFFTSKSRPMNNPIVDMIASIHNEISQIINHYPRIFGQFAWPDDNIRQREWQTAFTHLKPHGTLLPNGTKLRRKDHQTLLTHSFIIVDGKILAMAGHGHYLGSGISGKVKLAEDQNGALYALKISSYIEYTSRHVKVDKEADIAHDIGKALCGTQRKSLSGSKKYLANHYFFGKSLYQYLIDHQYATLSPDGRAKINMLATIPLKERIKLAITILEAIKDLNDGKQSKHGKKYSHGDLHLNNILINEQGEVYLIDFDRSSAITQEDQPTKTKNEFLDVKKNILNVVLGSGSVLKSLMEDETINTIPSCINKLHFQFDQIVESQPVAP